MNKRITEQPSPWRKSSKRESCHGDRVYMMRGPCTYSTDKRGLECGALAPVFYRRKRFSTNTCRKLGLLQKSPDISGNLQESTGERNQEILYSSSPLTGCGPPRSRPRVPPLSLWQGGPTLQPVITSTMLYSILYTIHYVRDTYYILYSILYIAGMLTFQRQTYIHERGSIDLCMSVAALNYTIP